MGRATMSMEGEVDRRTAFYIVFISLAWAAQLCRWKVRSIGELHFIIISGFSRLQKFGLSVGKGTVSKKIQEPSCEYESKAWMGQPQSQKGQDIV